MCLEVQCEGQALRSTDDRTLAIDGLKSPQALSVAPSGRWAIVMAKSEAIFIDLDRLCIVSRWGCKGTAELELFSDSELVLSNHQGLRWINAETGAVLTHSKSVGEARIAVSRDGSVVAAMYGVESAMLVGRDRPDTRVAFTPGSFPRRAAFSPDNSQLVIVGSESVVRLFDVSAALATRVEVKAKKRKG